MGSCEKRQESPRVHSPFWNAKHGAELRGEAPKPPPPPPPPSVCEKRQASPRVHSPLWNA